MTTAQIEEILNRFTAALGITCTVKVDETADGPRLNLEGDEAELLVRHRGEPLPAHPAWAIAAVSSGRTLQRRQISR